MGEQIVEKGVSKKIQGIAILMMIVHHAFGFPERLLPGISYIGIPMGGKKTRNIYRINVQDLCVTFCIWNGVWFGK